MIKLLTGASGSGVGIGEDNKSDQNPNFTPKSMPAEYEH